MKVNLVGVQAVDFTTREGELIQGQKLHVVGTVPVGTREFVGCEVSTVWLPVGSPLINTVATFQIPCMVDLVYNERVNGKRYLCDIKAIK